MPAHSVGDRRAKHAWKGRVTHPVRRFGELAENSAGIFEGLVPVPQRTGAKADELKRVPLWCLVLLSAWSTSISLPIAAMTRIIPASSAGVRKRPHP